MNLTRITNLHPSLINNRFVSCARALGLIIRFTNASAASAIFRAFSHLQTYSLSMSYLSIPAYTTRAVFARSKFRQKPTQPLRSRLLPLISSRKVKGPLATPRSGSQKSSSHANFSHPANAWRLNFLESLLSYKLLGPAKIEHFYAKIAHYTPTIAKKSNGWV